MKTVTFLTQFILSLLIAFSAHSSLAANNPWEPKLPFKQAEISYKAEGTAKGTSTLYVKDYGRTTAKYTNTEMKIFGMSQKTREVVITTPEWMYTFNLEENTGSKQTNPLKYMQDEYKKLSKADQKKARQRAEEQGVAMVSSMGGTVEKNAKKILGYQCDKTTAMGTTVYTISGTQLPLRVKSNLMGIKIKETATNIKKGSVPSAKFEFPKGIKPIHDTSADNMMKSQAKAMMEGLLSDGQKSSSSQREQTIKEDSNDESESSGEQEEQMKQMQKMFDMFGS